jgi:gas vesicle protein
MLWHRDPTALLRRCTTGLLIILSTTTTLPQSLTEAAEILTAAARSPLHITRAYQMSQNMEQQTILSAATYSICLANDLLSIINHYESRSVMHESTRFIYDALNLINLLSDPPQKKRMKSLLKSQPQLDDDCELFLCYILPMIESIGATYIATHPHPTAEEAHFHQYIQGIVSLAYYCGEYIKTESEATGYIQLGLMLETCCLMAHHIGDMPEATTTKNQSSSTTDDAEETSAPKEKKKPRKKHSRKEEDPDSETFEEKFSHIKNIPAQKIKRHFNNKENLATLQANLLRAQRKTLNRYQRSVGEKKFVETMNKQQHNEQIKNSIERLNKYIYARPSDTPTLDALFTKRHLVETIQRCQAYLESRSTHNKTNKKEPHKTLINYLTQNRDNLVDTIAAI